VAGNRKSINSHFQPGAKVPVPDPMKYSANIALNTAARWAAPEGWRPTPSGTSGAFSHSSASLVPVNGLLKNLQCATDSAVATGSLVPVIAVNGVDSALTCTIAIGATAASDVVHTVPVSAGDSVSVHWPANTNDGAVFLVVAFELLPT
jgi:hypothetical protein